MRHYLFLTFCIIVLNAQNNDQMPIDTNQVKVSEMKIEKTIVEAACGQCQFDLPGGGCDLAIRIDGIAYFVEGTDIDDHGDAHAADGFCESIRHAEVIGYIDNEKYVVSSFELLKIENISPKTKQK